MKNYDQKLDIDNNFQVLGQAAWLFVHSPLHKDWSYDSAKRWVIPAILHKQYRLFDEGGFPVAWLSWGWFTDVTIHQYLKNPDSLQPGQWKGGKHLWFIDFCAPWGHTHLVAKELKNGIFKGQTANFLRVRTTRLHSRIARLRGRNAERKR